MKVFFWQRVLGLAMVVEGLLWMVCIPTKCGPRRRGLAFRAALRVMKAKGKIKTYE